MSNNIYVITNKATLLEDIRPTLLNLGSKEDNIQTPLHKKESSVIKILHTAHLLH